jgi:hypothetical protein
MAIVDMAEILFFLGIEENVAEDHNLKAMRDAVEAWVQVVYCKRNFESQSYTKEKYDGAGSRYLYLNNIPVTAVNRLAIGTRDVMDVCNAAKYTIASVSASSSALMLYKDGSSTTLAFSTYTTMSLLAAAVIAAGGSWNSRMSGTEFSSFASTELITFMGKNCIDSNWVSLKIPEDGEYDFEIDEANGVIHSDWLIDEGRRNVFVDYTAGYSASTMPEDLKLAIKIVMKTMYQKRSEESFGLTNYGLSGVSIAYEAGVFPKEALDILGRYRTILI